MELGWPGNRTFKWNVISLGKRMVVVRAQYCHTFQWKSSQIFKHLR